MSIPVVGEGDAVDVDLPTGTLVEAEVTCIRWDGDTILIKLKPLDWEAIPY